MYRSSRLLFFILVAALGLGAASCVAPLDAPSPGTSLTNAADFFWSARQLNAGVHFQITSDTTVENHTLTSADGTHITDISGTSTGALVIRATRDSIIVDSISTHTIFLLPPGFSFASRVPQGVPITSLLELRSGRLVAGSRSSGIYYKEASSGWTHASGLSIGVQALALDSTKNILYAAAADSIFESFDGGGTWVGLLRPKQNASITALATDSRGHVLAGLSGDGGIVRTDSAGDFQPFAQSAASVISIATIDTGKTHYVAATTTTSATLYNDTGTAISNYSESSISQIVSVDGNTALLVAGHGLVQLSLEPSPAWKALPGTASENLRSAAHVGSFVYAGGDSGTIYQFTGIGATALAKATTPINSAIASGSRVLLATDDGAWQYANGSLTRLNGPYLDQPHDGAPGLTLIAREPQGLSIGSTWPAGNLYISAVQASVPVTARVIDHVDSLLSPVLNSKLPRFGETYVVRYALETNGALDPSFPVYWLVYYSRGSGPVIIEEYVPAPSGGFMLKSRATMID